MGIRISFIVLFEKDKYLTPWQNLPTDCGSINKTLTRRTSTDLSKKTTFSPSSEEGKEPLATAEPGTLKASLIELPAIDKFTEKESAHPSQRQLDKLTKQGGNPGVLFDGTSSLSDSQKRDLSRQVSVESSTRTGASSINIESNIHPPLSPKSLESWIPTQDWVSSWKSKLPLQTIMRLLQVLVPQVEKICIDKGITDESEILRFLQHGTLVGLLPVPHPILIRKYQPNPGTALWFRTYMWGVIYLRNTDPPICSAVTSNCYLTITGKQGTFLVDHRFLEGDGFIVQHLVSLILKTKSMCTLHPVSIRINFNQ
ncbi:Protein HID1 [Lepeophtheirus salmonis]|uniref:Protein HID1 n=1 Tax=Lepeophtheirus salmonis TaxID=72036 RepID=A0A7R8CI80_LEPSM|nr:Protein HID1 [Lepeophtheirus salmonis]CAF2824844.1 Protein HID1 [Lepeophtheirus salmonis]